PPGSATPSGGTGPARPGPAPRRYGSTHRSASPPPPPGAGRTRPRAPAPTRRRRRADGGRGSGGIPARGATFRWEALPQSFAAAAVKPFLTSLRIVRLVAGVRQDRTISDEGGACLIVLDCQASARVLRAPARQEDPPRLFADIDRPGPGAGAVIADPEPVIARADRNLRRLIGGQSRSAADGREDRTGQQCRGGKSQASCREAKGAGLPFRRAISHVV